jgi:uncharacterized protein (DUF2147 family)
MVRVNEGKWGQEVAKYSPCSGAICCYTNPLP